MIKKKLHLLKYLYFKHNNLFTEQRKSKNG